MDWLIHPHGVSPRQADDLRPHFLIAAAPKTGSTWLADNLRLHPEAFVPNIKEVKWFSSLGRWLPFDWYLHHFDGGEGKMRGEASPSYAALPVERIELVRRLFPDIKLVFLLREPVCRAWSHVRHTWRYREAGFLGATEPDWIAGAGHEWLTASGDYLGHLRRWLSVFPREQVMVRFYEDIARQPERLFREVLAFLGLDPSLPLDGFPLREVINAGEERPMPDEARSFLHRLWHGRTRELATFLKKEFGLETPPEWGSVLTPPQGGSLSSSVFAPGFDDRLPAVAALEESFPTSVRHVGYLDGFHLFLRNGRIEADGHGILLHAGSLPELKLLIASHLAGLERERQDAERKAELAALETKLAHALMIAERAERRAGELARALHEAGRTVQHLERQVERLRPWWRVAGRWLADALNGKKAATRRPPPDGRPLGEELGAA